VESLSLDFNASARNIPAHPKVVWIFVIPVDKSERYSKQKRAPSIRVSWDDVKHCENIALSPHLEDREWHICY
jgi:hypothetical protein